MNASDRDLTVQDGRQRIQQAAALYREIADLLTLAQTFMTRDRAEIETLNRRIDDLQTELGPLRKRVEQMERDIKQAQTAIQQTKNKAGDNP